jgi:hypothetical protein
MHEIFFEFVLGFYGFVRAEIGAFRQEHIDIERRARHDPIDENGFPTMPAKIAGVENSLPATLDQQHVGVERRMVRQQRCDPERPDRERP